MISKSTIKDIQSLQHKKFRDESDSFIAEGPKVVIGLIESGVFPLQAVFAVQDWVEELYSLQMPGLHEKIEIVKDFELEKLASYATANKVVAVFQKRESIKKNEIGNRFTIALDDMQDPGNFGTIIRTADWFAVENIICSEHTVDMYNSKVVQSTMASLGRVNIVYTDLYNWLSKQEKAEIYAATLQGKLINEIKKPEEGIIVIGNESKGIKDSILQLATEKITIPKKGHAESLNAAVATGIILAKFML